MPPRLRAAAIAFWSLAAVLVALLVQSSCTDFGVPPRGAMIAPPADTIFATRIQPIFDRNHCSTAGCHGGPGTPAEGMDLSPGRAYAQIVNVRSTGFHDYWRVKPFDPDSSLIYVKVSDLCASPLTCPTGERMPRGFPPLTAEEIETIRAWIATGAAP